ncbi:hypothetical protein ANANG_G00161220 [Anguilla anguilla]|uniref:P2X purinoreceptor 7 intracellular domain-containing protein n=1 Tax=Anguilla anguilla TaxID=7936 RepID=A0A9D3RUS4_ANGAN|nr:hypothetical protein ANANG_G00161220 [Anguilla anguilla]
MSQQTQILKMESHRHHPQKIGGRTKCSRNGAHVESAKPCLLRQKTSAAENLHRAEHGPLDVRQRAARARYLAYRQFVSWCWGYLGRRIRVVIPSCVVLRIHCEYPDEEDHHTGFRPPLDD